MSSLQEQFERLGAETVRMYLANHRFNHDVEIQAISWLAEEDAKIKAKAEEAKREQRILPRIAIGISIVALIVGIINALSK